MYCVFFFFKQKTAYEMRISDWSSDVCSSDLSDQDSSFRRVFTHVDRRTKIPRIHAQGRAGRRAQDPERRLHRSDRQILSRKVAGGVRLADGDRKSVV